MKKIKRILVEPGTYPEKHELYTAEALSKKYGQILFKKPINKYRVKSADIRMSNLLWEIKAPKTSYFDGIEQSLKRASKQSGNIVIDSFRVKKIKDEEILSFLGRKAIQQRVIKRLIFINKKREVLEIKMK